MTVPSLPLARLRQWLCLAWAVLGLTPGLSLAQAHPDFPSWLAGVRQEALAQGISETTLETALGDLQPLDRVLELDRHQPEFIETFWNYLDRRVTPQRVAQGQRLLQQHAALLAEVERQYGVPARFLMAFWGLETHFGSHLGTHRVIDALATLAYDGRRSAFFRRELLDALAILDAGHVEANRFLGSWAGAMGQLQFMPSTFQHYAVDGDGDGRKDLWNSLPDAFHSAGHYLQRLGWRQGETWGREVRLPADFDWQEAQLGVKKPLSAWARQGVTLADGTPLPNSDTESAILLPQGHAGPAFLVYRNFEIILAWNRSISYALAVGHMADRLAGAAPLALGRAADNRRLAREQVIALQQGLAGLGFDPGAVDGVLGAQTKAAIRAYQRAKGLPADGHPSLGLLEALLADGVATLTQTPQVARGG